MGTLVLVIERCLKNIDLAGSCIGHLVSQQSNELHGYQMQTCAVEAITNCVRHSYRDMAEWKVEIHYQIHADKIIIDIADTGCAMDPHIFENASADFNYNPMDTENLPEGGWGLKLIKAWMDESDYYSENGVNHFRLVKHVPPADDPDSY